MKITSSSVAEKYKMTYGSTWTNTAHKWTTPIF